MRLFNRGFLLAASLPLVLLLAGPALAYSEFSDYKCLNPQSAANDTYNYFSDNEIDTSDFENPKDCEKLCKELLKICIKNVKNRIACIETDDAFILKLEKELCDVYYEGDQAKACKEEVKSVKSSYKEDNKSYEEDGEANCEDAFGVDGFCQSDCEDGSLDDD